MDNLYLSAAFCKKSKTHPKNIMILGVASKGMRGVPECVKQEIVMNKKKQIEVRGTVKAVVLKGDDKCPKLVCCSVYDAKPVHFFSMSCPSLKWKILNRKVYNVDTGEQEMMEFLRLNTIHDYNMKMGGVDMADQLRGVYCLDRWI